MTILLLLILMINHEIIIHAISQLRSRVSSVNLELVARVIETHFGSISYGEIKTNR